MHPFLFSDNTTLRFFHLCICAPLLHTHTYTHTLSLSLSLSLSVSFCLSWSISQLSLCPLLSSSVLEVFSSYFFWTVMLEKTLESPSECQKIQPVHPKGDQFWVFVGRTDVETEAPILWPPDVKNRLIWKDPYAGKDWGQEKGTTEDEMVGWHHWLKGHEFG